jgi:hypothetical protein
MATVTSIFPNAREFSIGNFTNIQATNVTLNTASPAFVDAQEGALSRNIARVTNNLEVLITMNHIIDRDVQEGEGHSNEHLRPLFKTDLKTDRCASLERVAANIVVGRTAVVLKLEMSLTAPRQPFFFLNHRF